MWTFKKKDSFVSAEPAELTEDRVVEIIDKLLETWALRAVEACNFEYEHQLERGKEYWVSRKFYIPSPLSMHRLELVESARYEKAKWTGLYFDMDGKKLYPSAIKEVGNLAETEPEFD